MLNVTKNSATPSEHSRSHSKCCLGVSGVLRNGMITSCRIVLDALKMRESSVESTSMIISRPKRPSNPTGKL